MPFLPKFLFYLSAKLFGEACLELCVLRDKKQIYLARRPDNDPYWAGMLHIPGVRKLPGDTDEKQIKRLLAEFDIPINPDDIRYAFSATVTRKRGTLFTDVRVVTVHSAIGGDAHFYDMDDLPKDVIPEHIPVIERIRHE